MRSVRVHLKWVTLVTLNFGHSGQKFPSCNDALLALRSLDEEVVADDQLGTFMDPNPPPETLLAAFPSRLPLLIRLRFVFTPSSPSSVSSFAIASPPPLSSLPRRASGRSLACVRPRFRSLPHFSAMSSVDPGKVVQESRRVRNERNARRRANPDGPTNERRRVTAA